MNNDTNQLTRLANILFWVLGKKSADFRFRAASTKIRRHPEGLFWICSLYKMVKECLFLPSVKREVWGSRLCGDVGQRLLPFSARTRCPSGKEMGRRLLMSHSCSQTAGAALLMSQWYLEVKKSQAAFLSHVAKLQRCSRPAAAAQFVLAITGWFHRRLPSICHRPPVAAVFVCFYLQHSAASLSSWNPCLS